MPTTPPNVSDLIVSLITSEKFIAGFFGLTGGTIATFIAPWTKWHFKEKELRSEGRKEKIRYWREELNKFVKSPSELYKTPLYSELVEYIPKEERTELLNNKSIEIDIGGPLGPESTMLEDRIFDRFHKVISDKEKEWGII